MELKCVLEGLGFRKVEEDDKFEYWVYRLSEIGSELAIRKSDHENFWQKENGILNTIGIHIHAIGKRDERERIRKML